jgi:hypothetical protein
MTRRGGGRAPGGSVGEDAAVPARGAPHDGRGYAASMVCVRWQVAAQACKHYAKAIVYMKKISFDLDTLVDLY